MDDAKTKVDLIVVIDKILQILFQIFIADITGKPDIVVIGIDPDLIAVFAIDQ